MKAREYQEACVDAVLSAIGCGHKSILCTLFTGAGKTVIFGLIARALGNCRIIVIAPMRELVWQCADTADRMVGEDAEVEMGRHFAMFGGRVVVASKQTLLSGREKRYKRLLGAQIIIVDEAHSQYSPAVLAMLRDFQAHGGVVIGFTATPFRMDGRRLTDFYETVAFEYGLERGIHDAWCVPPVAKLVRCEGLSLDKVSISGGDFSAGDLDMVMGASRSLHAMCLTIQRERRGSGIFFLPGVRTAAALAELASSAYGMRAQFICGDTRIQPEDERNRIINKFRRGEVDVLCNCMIATMGFDAPVAQTIGMFRPTRSRVLWFQAIGRATRVLPDTFAGNGFAGMSGHLGRSARSLAIARGPKDHFKIIDMTDSTADQSIVTAVDMFAKDQDAAVVARARRAAENEEGNPEDLLAQAAEDVRKAQVIEAGLKAMRGQASGEIRSQVVDIGIGRKDISQYLCPLRGRFAKKTMGELDDGIIRWALRQPGIKGWQRSYFVREQARRAAVGNPG